MDIVDQARTRDPAFPSDTLNVTASPRSAIGKWAGASAFLVALLVAFGVVVLVELPDKTLIATLVLSTRYRPRPVLAGVALVLIATVAAVAGRVIVPAGTGPSGASRRRHPVLRGSRSWPQSPRYAAGLGAAHIAQETR